MPSRAEMPSPRRSMKQHAVPFSPHDRRVLADGRQLWQSSHGEAVEVRVRVTGG